MSKWMLRPVNGCRNKPTVLHTHPTLASWTSFRTMPIFAALHFGWPGWKAAPTTLESSVQSPLQERLHHRNPRCHRLLHCKKFQHMPYMDPRWCSCCSCLRSAYSLHYRKNCHHRNPRYHRLLEAALGVRRGKERPAVNATRRFVVAGSTGEACFMCSSFLDLKHQINHRRLSYSSQT